MREESFGPIIGIQKVVDDTTRCALDERHRLRLTASHPDEARARRLARLHAGSVYWNCCDRVSPRLPWSGLEHSGIGLTLSTYGIEVHRPKAWHAQCVKDVRDASRRRIRSRRHRAAALKTSTAGGFGRPVPALIKNKQDRETAVADEALTRRRGRRRHGSW